MDSTSDERVVNNVVRHEYKVLTEREKEAMKCIKDDGLRFITSLDHYLLLDTREGALAKTKIEEAVFWAVKRITR